MRDHRHRQTALGPHVAAFLDDAEIGGWLGERTRADYERDLAKGMNLFPALGPDDWSKAELVAALKTVPEGSRKRVRAAWVTFFDWAWREGVCTRRPETDRLPRIRQAKSIPAQFTDAEVDLLCSLPLVDGVLMMLLLDTGLRKEEASNVRLGDCDLRLGVLSVRVAKGGKPRTVPMTPRLVAKIAELALVEGLDADDHLFYSVKKTPRAPDRILRARPISAASFHRWYGRSIEAAGVTYRKPHTTRHTFAMRYLRGVTGRSAADLPTEAETVRGTPGGLQRFLGHASADTTAIYGRLDTAALMAELRAMLGMVSVE